MRLLLTGNPGVGKTTLIRAIIQRLEGIRCAGFYTAEKRRSGQIEVTRTNRNELPETLARKFRLQLGRNP